MCLCGRCGSSTLYDTHMDDSTTDRPIPTLLTAHCHLTELLNSFTVFSELGFKIRVELALEPTYIIYRQSG